MGEREDQLYHQLELDKRVAKLDAQLEWYAEQVQEYEQVARRLDGACERALRMLDQVTCADSFQVAFDRLALARRLLRERHER